MIIKGSSRSGPKQLAAHLQRTDTNERIALLELHSGISDLAGTFRDWQTLAEGTRGSKGLYHVNIDPDARYTMTPAQWSRAVDVLEKELGLEGQPRAVVMHEKHGRQHIHVVWARTDIETMTLRSDGNNYAAHERASQALELEFGHEPVPGKHTKRDREKQPEPPKAAITHAEWQQAERSGLSIEERRDQLAALHRASDNGTAFKTALEEAGYIVAQGDRRDFVIVDQTGEAFSLGRELKLKAKEVRDFMADVDRAQLPTAAEAAALQRAPDRKTAQGESASVPPPPAEAPAPVTEAATEPAAPPALDPAVAQALADRQATELQKWRDWHAKELADLDFKMSLDVRDKLNAIDAMHSAARERLAREHQHQAADLWERIQRRINPAAAAARVLARRQEADALRNRQFRERKDQLALELQTKELELAALKERHILKLRDVEAGFEKDRARYEHDYAEAQRLMAEWQELRRQQEEERLRRDGPHPGLGPPGMTK